MSRAWKRDILWWFALAVVGLLVNAAACFRSLIALVNDSQRLAHSQQVLSHLENMLSLVKDAETGQRGYLLTSRPSYLEPYREAVRQIGSELSELRRLTGDQPFFVERLPLLQQAVAGKLDELDRTIELESNGHQPAAIEEVRSDRGKKMMEVIRTRWQELVNHEKDRVDLRAAESRSAARVAQLTFALATIVDILLLGFVALLIHRNIAIREKNAESLRKSEEQLRLLMDGAQDYALIQLDREGKVASWNTGAEKLFGYTADAILGQSIARFYSPEERDDKSSSNQHLQAAKAKGRAEELGWRVRADGSRFWADAVLTPLQSPEKGSLVGYALMTRDLTERRQVEERLRVAESRFRRLVDADLIGVITADFSGRIWEANDAFLRMIGRTRLELNSGAIRWNEITPPEHTSQDSPVISQLQTTGIVAPFEKEYRRKDGVPVPVLVGAARLEGAEDRCVCFVLDLTERKQAEEEVRRINAALERRVEERTRQLQESNRELESFSYSVSHDLRAPLRHLSGFADLLQKRASEGLDETSRRYARIIADAARNAGRLVDDLLAFSRMARTELKKTPVSMADLVAQVVHELEPEIEGRQVRWTIGSLPTVPGDLAMLRQVIRNLLSNALKYTRDRYPAEIQIGTVETSANGAAKKVTFFVRDNGVGFDMQYVDKLFGVFQRLHSTEQFEGNGIGLANVRRIIARHGGETRAEGAPDKGATIYFSLPKSPTEHHV
jgi:PAS domain S-box-containing protein